MDLSKGLAEGKTQKPRPGYASRSGWRTSKWQPACLSLPLADFSSPPSQLPSSSPFTSQFCFEPGNRALFSLHKREQQLCPQQLVVFSEGEGQRGQGNRRGAQHTVEFHFPFSSHTTLPAPPALHTHTLTGPTLAAYLTNNKWPAAF